MQNIEVEIKKYDSYFITPNYDNNISKKYFEKIEKVLDQNEDVEGLISCAGVGYFGNIENF